MQTRKKKRKQKTKEKGERRATATPLHKRQIQLPANWSVVLLLCVSLLHLDSHSSTIERVGLHSFTLPRIFICLLSLTPHHSSFFVVNMHYLRFQKRNSLATIPSRHSRINSNTYYFSFFFPFFFLSFIFFNVMLGSITSVPCSSLLNCSSCLLRETIPRTLEQTGYTITSTQW